MSFASSPSLRVKARKRHRPSPNHRWIKSFAGGLVLAVLVCGMIAAAMTAGGKLTGVSLDARSSNRPLAGLSAPSGRFVLLAMPAETMPPALQKAARLALPQPAADDRPQSIAATPPAPQISSGVLANISADQIYTGSLGRHSFKLQPAVVAATEPAASRAKLETDRAPPLPRIRPQLASLPPAGDMGIAPDEDAPSPRTAIYDITAQAVYLPNGDRLEAHSGLGQFMDSPKHVHLRMRGATPPNTYKLTMREALFHGVQAIRMTPLDESTMFRRNGILAHSYMLGPSGQSNGCISFKDYPKFLAAFKRGDVDHIVVVSRLAKPPAFYARRNIKSASNTF